MIFGSTILGPLDENGGTIGAASLSNSVFALLIFATGFLCNWIPVRSNFRINQ